jgi:DNA-3-methyladenine glycosylase
MFGPPGRAYVYLVYGMHCCLNVVTQPEGRPAAFLIRAVDPLEGADLMRCARGDWVESNTGRKSAEGAAARAAARRRVAALPQAALASGPGLVCAAFSITRADHGIDLCDPSAPLHLEPARDEDSPLAVATGPRIGIAYAAEPWLSRPWRFWAAGNPAVSGVRSGAGSSASSAARSSR